jgi:hypothetical protein
MKTLYEVLNVDLSQEYTKARKLAKLEEFAGKYTEVLEEAKAAIAAMDIPEDNERHHWITYFGKRAAADLLTLGKVQPETMLEMSCLPVEDFKEVVKIATSSARKLNDITIQTEKELNTNTISDALV